VWRSSGAGEKLAVTAHATLAVTGDAIEVTCDMAMAMAEGWTRNAKYKSMPEHMLRWRSAAMLIRLYAPEVMLGMPVIEELETLPEAIRDVTPAATQNMKAALDEFAGSKPPMGNEMDEFTGPGAAKDESDKPSILDEIPEISGCQPYAELKSAIDARQAAQAAAEVEIVADKQIATPWGYEGTNTVAMQQGGAAPADNIDENPAPKADAKETPDLYLEMLKAHVDWATDPADLKAWYTSTEQKKRRATCGLIGEKLDEAKNYTLARIGTLAKKES
jgi:hypothetical protein